MVQIGLSPLLMSGAEIVLPRFVCGVVIGKMKKVFLFLLLFMPLVEVQPQDTLNVNLNKNEDPQLIALKQRELDQQKAADEQKARIESARLADERQAMQDKADKESFEDWKKWAASVRQKCNE